MISIAPSEVSSIDVIRKIADDSVQGMTTGIEGTTPTAEPVQIFSCKGKIMYLTRWVTTPNPLVQFALSESKTTSVLLFRNIRIPLFRIRITPPFAEQVVGMRYYDNLQFLMRTATTLYFATQMMCNLRQAPLHCIYKVASTPCWINENLNNFHAIESLAPDHCINGNVMNVLLFCTIHSPKKQIRRD